MRSDRFVAGFRRSLTGLVITLLFAGVIGYAVGRTIESLLLVVSAYLVLQLVALWRFGSDTSGLHDRIKGPGLDAWRALGAGIHRRQRRNTQQRRRLVGALQTYRDAAAALPDAVVAVDREQRVIWFNRAARLLLQLDPKRDTGAHLTHLLRSPGMVEWLANETDEALEDVPAPSDRKVRLSLRQIRDVHGQRLVIAHDISQLQRLEQVRRDFVANVSHELRTPLTVVHGYLDMIDPEDVPEYAPILRELRSQSRRMTEIVEDLLTLSRLDGNDSAGSHEHVHMVPMLETLRRDAQALSQGRHKINVERCSDQDLSGSVKDLHSAFSNLVSNAVRYTPDGGIVTVRWRSDGDGCRLEVSDSGLGIPAHHLPRLTERFYRVSTSRSRDTGGTGLGLSIVNHILQLHGSRLDISSELGLGSTFSCVFEKSRLRDPIPVAQEA